MIIAPKQKAEDLFVIFFERIPDFAMPKQEASHEALFQAFKVVEEVQIALIRGNANISELEYWSGVKKELSDLDARLQGSEHLSIK